MFNEENVSFKDKTDLYAFLYKQAAIMIEGESDLIANMANLSALLYHYPPEVNWVGFYRITGKELVLGPFQGKPACIRIPVGKGVCGTAVIKKKTIIVEEVHAFPGHISCDSASLSEIVIPLNKNDRVFGVLDIDSPVKKRFDEKDQSGLEKIALLIK